MINSVNSQRLDQPIEPEHGTTRALIIIMLELGLPRQLRICGEHVIESPLRQATVMFTDPRCFVLNNSGEYLGEYFSPHLRAAPTNAPTPLAPKGPPLPEPTGIGQRQRQPHAQAWN